MTNLSSVEIENELKRILKIPCDGPAPQQPPRPPPVRRENDQDAGISERATDPSSGQLLLPHPTQPQLAGTKRVRHRKNKTAAAASATTMTAAISAESQKLAHLPPSSLLNRALSDVQLQKGSDAAAKVDTKNHVEVSSSSTTTKEEADEVLSCVLNASREMRTFNLAKLSNLPNLKDLPPDLLKILRSQGILPVQKKSPKHPNARFNCTLCKYHCDTLNVCETHIRGDRHLALLTEQNMDISLRQLPVPNPLQTAAIDRMLEKIVAEHEITDEYFARRLNIVKELDALLTANLPDGCRVRMFGSVFTQLGLRGSPVNVDLDVPLNSPHNPAFMLKQCSMLLSVASGGYSNVTCDFEAKLPSISFVHCDSGEAFVMSLNKIASWQTSKLLREYGLLDPRCRKLAVAFRLWAKVCKLDNQMEGTLPPHAFDLMLVYFLQQLTPPVLPVLHDFISITVAKGEVEYASAKEVAARWKTRNSMSLGYLWVELFRYYAVIFPKVACAVCITDSKPLPLSAKKWQGARLGIEDPFTKKRNLTRCISSKRMGDFVMSCFKYSFQYFGIPQTKCGPLFTTIRPPPNLKSQTTLSGEAKRTTTKEAPAGTPLNNEKFGCYLTDDEKINHMGERLLPPGFTTEDVSANVLLEIQRLVSPQTDSSLVVLTTPQRIDCSDGKDVDLPDASISHFGNAVTNKPDDTSEPSDSDNSDSEGDEDGGGGGDGHANSDDGAATHRPSKDEGGDAASTDSPKKKQQQQSGRGETKAKRSKKKEKRALLFRLLPTPSEILKLIATVGASNYIYEFVWKILTNGLVPLIECTICQKEGHLKTDCPDEKLPPLIPLPPPNEAFLQRITRLCVAVAEFVQATRSEVDDRTKVLRELKEFTRQFYPDAEMKLFGSSCNGFGFRRSDLDICLTFASNDTGKGLNYADIIVQLAEKLKNFKAVTQVIPIPTAKVPIVKFVHRWSKLDCDLSLYNNLAHHNTQMLLLYTKIDPRVPILGCMIKHFAKLCSIGDASRGSLSSYAYILMMLHFLQQRQPPVIPVLQEIYYEGKTPPTVMVDGWNAWFFSLFADLKEVWPHHQKNKESLGQLWLGFLRYYAEVFNVKENVINIRQLKPLSRFEKLWNSKCLAIEDPFDLSHNLGSGISRKMNAHILKAFIKGRELFGTPIFTIPVGHNSIEEYLLNNELLTGGPPPTDGCCRFCGKIGHWARHCPRKQNMKDTEERRRTERRRTPKNGLAAQQQQQQQQHDRQAISNRFQQNRVQDQWRNRQQPPQQQQSSSNWRDRATDQHSQVPSDQHPKAKPVAQQQQHQQQPRSRNTAGHAHSIGTANHLAMSPPDRHQYFQGPQFAGGIGHSNKMSPPVVVSNHNANFQLFGNGSRPARPMAFNPESTSSPMPSFPVMSNGELPPRRLDVARPQQQQQQLPWRHGMGPPSSIGPPPGFGQPQPPRPYYGGAPPQLMQQPPANLYGFSGPPSRTIPPFASPRPDFSVAPGSHLYGGGAESGKRERRMVPVEAGHVPKSF